MKPVNIFRISRIRDEDLFNIAAKHEADDHDNHRVRSHEIRSLRLLVDALSEEGCTAGEFDGFYHGFIIPRIGKEFDLLKVTAKRCLNIELKSQDVTAGNIHAQLLKNRHYLNHLGKKLSLYTVVTDTLTCYRLTSTGRLVFSSIREIAASVRRCDAEYDRHIEKSFSTTEFLISPEDDPDKFLLKQYFLTPAQDQVRKELLRDIGNVSGGAFFSITGKPCTGKTLLIYDLARTLAERGPALIVARGELSDGLNAISNSIDNLDFVSAGSLPPSEELEKYEYILVDEALRMSAEAFSIICYTARKNARICIFSADPDAVLTRDERARDISGKIRALELSGEYVLSERLRLNMEIHTFIQKLRHLGCRTDRAYDYDDISVNYAGNAAEAADMIRYYRDSGHIFIDARADRSDGLFTEFEEVLRPGHVAGREYEKAVVLLDSSLYYDEEGYLRGIPAPDPDDLYPNIFYPDITRIRENLVLVIMDAPGLLRSILGIIG